MSGSCLLPFLLGAGEEDVRQIRAQLMRGDAGDAGNVSHAINGDLRPLGYGAVGDPALCRKFGFSASLRFQPFVEFVHHG